MADKALERAERALRAHPELSDRAIAKEAGVSHQTVGRARGKAGPNGPLDHASAAPVVQPADKPPPRSPRDVLNDIANDEGASATARVAAARALLAAAPKPPRPEADDDPITRRALQIAAERNRRLN